MLVGELGEPDDVGEHDRPAERRHRHVTEIAPLTLLARISPSSPGSQLACGRGPTAPRAASPVASRRDGDLDRARDRPGREPAAAPGAERDVAAHRLHLGVVDLRRRRCCPRRSRPSRGRPRRCARCCSRTRRGTRPRTRRPRPAPKRHARRPRSRARSRAQPLFVLTFTEPASPSTSIAPDSGADREVGPRRRTGPRAPSRRRARMSITPSSPSE